MKKKVNVAILGAAGRDYHNFLVNYKRNPRYDVKFFTATQIPGISKRKFPKSLAGELYKQDIPIFLEKDLEGLIKKYKIEECVFSYSDISHEDVMHLASRTISAGANFVMLGGEDTMIMSKKKIVSICAVRTGAGKSPVSRKVAEILKKHGKKIVAIRHPMPYGDLDRQEIQRFAEYGDFEKHKCTIEEREEYEPWIKSGIPIYAGVDYEKILRQAEKEAQIIIWDGGNNDLPFYFPDVHIVVLDPHRPGHELMYHPGEANFRMADVLVLNKIVSAPKQGIKVVEENIKKINSKAIVIKAESRMTVSGDSGLKGKDLKGKKVLIIEDGPTLTHGNMTYGAGYLVAKKYGAKIAKPWKYAVGSIKDVYKKYSHVRDVLPAMGYGKKQIKELERTINKVPCDIVIEATPINLKELIKIGKPVVEVDYHIKERGLSLEEVFKRLGVV
jgi:predicted GTPase